MAGTASPTSSSCKHGEPKLKPELISRSVILRYPRGRQDGGSYRVAPTRRRPAISGSVAAVCSALALSA